MSGSSPKQLLVNALQGMLPDSLVQRPKRGFTLPFEHWMRAALRPEIESTLGKNRHRAFERMALIPPVPAMCGLTF